MSVARPSLSPEAAQHYCRAARRLRHRYRNAPACLHRSLRQLHPATVVQATPVRSTLHVIDAAAGDRFASLVQDSLQGSLLPYSTRLALLKQAARMKIGRFEANLIIATVQHRARGGTIDEESRGGGWVYCVAIAVQILIAASAWWIAR